MELKHYSPTEWVGKDDDGAVNVDTRMLLIDRRASLAEVRLNTAARFPIRDSAWDCHVMCVTGSGFVEVNGEKSPLQPGDAVRCPKETDASLSTADEAMTVMLLEHVHQIGHSHS